MDIVIKTPTLVHTEEGIKIADTQMPLHAVVHLLKAEWPEHLVQMRFEFTDEQIADILAYIEQHPEEVEADYVAGRRQAEEYWQQKSNGKSSSEQEEQWPTWWPPDTMPGTIIHIIETKGAPMISHSRVSVYDVMHDYDEGSSPTELRDIYNLSSYQVKVALQYIESHRQILEPKLKKILIRKAEREQYYRAFEAAHTKWRMETNPPEMTPRRAALQALLEERRRARGEI